MRRRERSRLQALSPLRFSIIGLAILLVPKIAQQAMCKMAQAASPDAVCASPNLPPIMLALGWFLILVGVAGVCYKRYRQSTNVG